MISYKLDDQPLYLEPNKQPMGAETPAYRHKLCISNRQGGQHYGVPGWQVVVFLWEEISETSFRYLWTVMNPECDNSREPKEIFLTLTRQAECTCTQLMFPEFVTGVSRMSLPATIHMPS